MKTSTGLVILLVAISSLCAQTFWHEETVTDGTQLSWQDMAVDAAGQVHVVNVRENASGGRGIYYWLRSHPNQPATGSWAIGSSGGAQREQVSLAVDPDGRLHLAYVTRTGASSGALYYASKGYQDPVWSTQLVSSLASLHGLANTSIAVNSNGLPAIAYTGLTSNELRYASRDSGGTWTDQTALATANTGFRPSLQLTGVFIGNLVLISHYDSGDTALRLTRLVRNFGLPPGPASWTSEIVLNDGQSGISSDLRVLPDNSIGIAFSQISTNSDLRYSTKSGSTWTHEIVDTSSDEGGSFPQVGYLVSMDLDALNQPVITYPKGEFAVLAIVSQEIRQARRLANGRWGVEKIQKNLPSNTALTLSSATNGAGTPQVSVFLNPTDGDNSLSWLRSKNSHWVSRSLNQLLPNTGPGHPLGSCAITRQEDSQLILVHTIDNFSSRNLRLLRRTQGVSTLVGSQPWFAADQITLARPRVGDDVLFAAIQNDSIVTLTATSLSNGSSIHASALTGSALNAEQSMELDSNGRLHLLLTTTSGLSYFRSRIPELPTPQLLLDPVPLPGAPSGTGATLKLSPEGRLAISYYDSATDSLRLITQNQPGGPFNSPVTIATDPSALSQGQPTSDLVFIDEKPYVAWAKLDNFNRTFVRVVSSNGLLIREFFVRAPVNTVRLVNQRNNLTLVWQARANPSEGIPAHFGYGKCQTNGLLESDVTLAATIPGSFREASTLKTSSFSLSLDPFGMPEIAAVLSDITPPDDTGYLFTFQPADSLDEDQDRIPLVLENAYGLNPRIAESGLPISSDSVKLPSDDLLHRFHFNHLSLSPPRRESNDLQIGEFEYRLIRSPDLQTFPVPDFGGLYVANSTPVAVSSDPPLSRTTFHVGYPAAWRATRPRQFTFLEARRSGIR